MGTERPDMFPVSVEWAGTRLTHVRTPTGRSLDVATPPVFPEGMAGYVSPEELLAAAVGSCLLLSLVAVCEARDLPLHEVRVTAVGVPGRRDTGAYGFRAIEVTILAEAPEERLEQLATLVHRAERNCIVATALELPIELRLDLRASESRVAHAV